MLDDAGYKGTLATNSELYFERYLRCGDTLKSSAVMESISERKVTGLGLGYFVTWVTTYTDGEGAEVGSQRFRVLKFDPSTIGASTGGSRGGGKKEKPAPPQGEKLPDFELAVTATVIVAGAIASRDFMPVHHDRDYAKAQGAPDIFMNILTTNGYVSRYVTDWAGPEARVRSISIRLGAPAVPGLPLRFTGQVASEARQGDEIVTDVAVRAANDLGDHATGTVVIAKPA